MMKKLLIEFCKETLELNIKEVYFDSIKYIKNLDIYSIYLMNFKAIDEQNGVKDIFIKNIQKGKIKESLFCICEDFYKRYYKNNEEKNLFKIKRNTIITEEKTSTNEIKKVSIHFLNNENIDKTNNLVIFFVDVREMIKKKKKGWVEYLETDQNDILLIGVFKN